MTAIIFVGPSLPPEHTTDCPGLEFRPPVHQGGLYQATLERPAAIGVVDGYFDGAPAVWHKEILWALSEGIAVFGAASMGALRAAELHRFGMIGVGQIFADYRDGKLTDDDEVALVHGPAETNYIILSEPMVNIRATLACACAHSVIDTQAADSIAKVAKEQFYQERTWQSVVAAARPVVASDILARFETWLAGGKVDQKQADARALLDAVRRHVASDIQQTKTSFTFQYTQSWAHAPWRKTKPKIDEAGAAILDELRLTGDTYLQVRQKALLLALARDDSERSERRADRTAVAKEIGEFRLRHGLVRRSDLRRWSRENDMTEARFGDLMSDRAQFNGLARDLDRRLHADMLDVLRLENTYAPLRAKAASKAQVSKSPAIVAGPVAWPAVLVSWYFGGRLGAAVPDDLVGYSADLGLDSLEQFYDLLAAEYAFCQAEVQGIGSGEERQELLS